MVRPTLKKFIAENCCNYFACDPGHRPKPWCETRGKECVVLVGGERCRCFEEAVLPIDPDMGGLYVGATTPDPEQHNLGVGISPQKPHRRAVVPLERVGRVN